MKHPKFVILQLCLFIFFLSNTPKLISQEFNTQWTANWSHDGKYIAVGGVDKFIKIFDGTTFQLIKKINVGDEIYRLRWHPQKNILAVAAWGQGSRLIDLEKNQTILFKGLDNIGGRSIAWHKKKKLIAIADYEGLISIWNYKGNLIRTIPKDNTKSYVAVDWHPQKKEIIALDDYIRVYNTKGQLLKKLNHRKEKVLMLCIQWHPSGDFFVIGDYGDYQYQYPALLQFWTSDYNKIKEIKLSKAEYRNISWNKDATKLATASEALRIWSANGELLHEGKSKDLLWGVDWNPNGQYIITSSIEGYIKIWNKNAKLVKELDY